MPELETVDFSINLKSLQELDESMQESLLVILQDANDSADVENIYETETIYPEDLHILKGHYIVRSNTRREIAGFFVQPKDFTTSQDNWPVTSEFEGWASDACVEFCNSHGIVHLLRECHRQVELFFSNIVNNRARYSCFDEEDGEQEGHVAIEIEVSSEQSIVMHEYENWLNWKANSLKPEHANCFTLVFKRV